MTWSLTRRPTWRRPAATTKPVEAPLGSDTLLLSGFGADTGGGVYRLDDGSFERLDALSTTGLAVTGDRLARLLRAPSDLSSTGELLIYDRHGLLSYHRLDGVPDPHDAIYDGELLAVASSAANAVVWLDAAGRVVRRWSPDPSAGDAWHINGLQLAGGDVYITAFGQFRAHRDWAGPQRHGAGLLMRLNDRRVLTSGLTCPHSPRLHDEGWYVCDSQDQRLLLLPREGGSPVRSAQLAGWTRGVAVTEELVYVGESASRRPGGPPRASVAVLDRRSLQLMDRIPLPCAEVFDLQIVPDELANGLAVGPATNTHRVAEQLLAPAVDQSGTTLRFAGNPLPLDRLDLRLDVVLPGAAQAEGTIALQVEVQNPHRLHFASVPPYPVFIVAQWHGADGSLVAEPRFPLPRELRPLDRVSVPLHLKAPALPGPYRLSITMVQEHVAWFHDHGLLPITAAVAVRPPGAESQPVADPMRP